MNNKERIQKTLDGLGLKIGCYDLLIDTLSKKELSKVIDNMEFQNDTDVSIQRKKYVVEIDILENEIDFSVLTKEEYINRYGDERFEQL